VHGAHHGRMSDSRTPRGSHGAAGSAAEIDRQGTHLRREGAPLPIAGRPPSSRTNRTAGSESTQLTHMEIDAIAAALARNVADAVAQRVLELVHERQARELVDAGELARVLGVQREWVYEHSGQLGAIRLGDGPRPRLRFEVGRAVASFRELSATRGIVHLRAGPETPVPRPRRSRRGRR
jgi:hypothetical protein